MQLPNVAIYPYDILDIRMLCGKKNRMKTAVVP